MKFIPGGICAVKGVLAAGSCEDDYGMALIVSEDNTASAHQEQDTGRPSTGEQGIPGGWEALRHRG